MSREERDTSTLEEQISTAIEAGMAAQAAQNRLIEGLTVKQAEFCLSAVIARLLPLKRAEYHAHAMPEHRPSEADALRLAHTLNLRSVLSSHLVYIAEDSELESGVPARQARENAETLAGLYFAEFDEGIMAIRSEDAPTE
jgi:hypothetical protein